MNSTRSLRLIPGVFAIIAFLIGNAAGQPSAPAGASTNAAPSPASAESFAPPAAGDFFFHDGDAPIVFLGDSITEQRMYSTLIETYLLTRFPNWKVTFRNAGWDDDTAALIKRGDFAKALQRDVLALKPKVVLINFGMNDARGEDSTYEQYLTSMTNLADAIGKTGARVVFLTPTPEEKYEAGPPAGSSYNAVLKKYIDGLKIVADNEHAIFIDQFTPFVADIEAGRNANVLSPGPVSANSTGRLIPDGVKPNWGGHLIMAASILEAMHAPAEVSSVTVDADAHSIYGTRGCQVELSQVPNVAVQFKRTDQVLPWALPNDPLIDVAKKIPGVDLSTSLNKYDLKVLGLKDGTTYKLLIDGVPTGVFTAGDFAKGIDLTALTKGPIYDQLQSLLQTVKAKNDAYFQRWRNVQLFALPDWMATNSAVTAARDGEEARLDQVIADAEKKIDFLRQPAPHVFKIVAGK